METQKQKIEMITIYFKSSKEMNKKIKNFKNAVIKTGSTQCDCGESYCYRIFNEKTYKEIARFVLCESCYNQYE